MNFGAFSISRLPRLLFGAGTIMRVPALARDYGTRALLVTGARSLECSPPWEPLAREFTAQGVECERLTVSGEPSPTTVDDAVARWRNAGIEVVVGIGGGSVLDAAKAIAGLLPHGNSVLDHLEGVGRNVPYRGPSLPYIAAPTTAGTGSEATKNAVLSVAGPHGYKKSFRDECLVPEHAVVDPDLLATCPPEQIAANGMDALTQLLESYVSAKANPFTDALARSGLEAVKASLLPLWRGTGADPAQARAGMAYAATLSGITLAQVGLGSVHGLASPLGAYFPIPHGVVCGTLVAAATEINIRALRERAPGHPALDKYSELGALLSGRKPNYREAGWELLIDTLQRWTDELKLPRLSRYEVRPEHLNKIVSNSRGSSMQTNPIVLADSEILEVLQHRL